LIARYGDCAEYLAGTLLDEGRIHNAGQLLLWRAVMEMKGRGLKRFDVGGMDEALTPKGIYDFKSGLGGVPYRHMNELEADDGSMRSRMVRWRVQRARAP
jgi:lipid II:glycine glycyltransferase (peptidoglycan interpeptide bridge formation enzyme)